MSSSGSDRSVPYMIGIDEAGRGPVLGPLVYAAAYCPLSHQPMLDQVGFDDSKILTIEQRDHFLELIDSCDFLHYELDVIDSWKISSSMLHRRKYNLNQLSFDAAMGLIDKIIAKGILVKQVFVDTVGDPETYQNKLSVRYPTIEVTVRKKADSLFAIVSAASICAKTRRDAIINEWKFKEESLSNVFDRNYGSGYPSDPKTKAWLSDNCSTVFGFPDFVRFSWSTCSSILQDRCSKVSWSDDLDDKQRTIAECFANITQTPCKKRNAFFQRRNMMPLEAKIS